MKAAGLPRRYASSSLWRGWRGPRDTLIRQAHPNEVPQLQGRALTPAARRGPLRRRAIYDAAIADALDKSINPEYLVERDNGATGGTFRMPRDWDGVFKVSETTLRMLTVWLIAVDGQGSLLGSVKATPTFKLSMGPTPDVVIPKAATTVFRVSHLEVRMDRRGQGVGTELLSRLRWIAYNSGYLLIHGTISAGGSLASYFSSRGCKVGSLGSAIDLAPIWNPTASIPVEKGQRPVYVYL